MDMQGDGIDRRQLLAAMAAGGGIAALAGAAGAETPAPAPASGEAASDAASVPDGPPPSAARAEAAVAEVQDAILRLSREVWATPELSLHEEKSHRIHLRELEAEGFRITSRGTSGIPTAFVAEWSQGRGGPVIGYLPEYDALPGLGNAAEPRQTPGPTGAEVAHGCGHNMLGAGCTGAAFALRRMMAADGTPGTIRVYGCAAEEVEGAKVYMARDGLCDDLDAALAWHPAPFAGAGLVRTAALDKAKVRFRGRSAHAGNSPWEGRSALKGAEMFGIGVQMMREHLPPTARVHYVYEAAGVAPNVVPDFAEIWIVCRDLDRAGVEAISRWLAEIAEGAARATQTTAEFEIFIGVYDLLPNAPLARLLHRHLSAVPLDWTAEEQAFARACQREGGLPEAGLAGRPLPFMDDVTAGGSTDVGDVSYCAPAGVFAWPTFPLGFGLHTWAVTACGGMSIGDSAALATARVLAAAGHDLMTDPDLRAAAREDFLKRRGDKPFVSALPPDRKLPLGLELRFVKTAGEEIFDTTGAAP